jgi:hypothetical protein
MPVASLVLIDIAISILAFIIAYKLRQGTPLFVWRRKSVLPVGIWDEFEPYLSLLLFVPFVKVIVLNRYGFYKLRGAFSFSEDFVRVLKASAISLLVLVLIAFLFRQGISYRGGELVYLADFSFSRLFFFYDWLLFAGMLLVTRSVVRLVQITLRYNELSRP